MPLLAYLIFPRKKQLYPSRNERFVFQPCSGLSTWTICSQPCPFSRPYNPRRSIAFPARGTACRAEIGPRSKRWWSSSRRPITGRICGSSAAALESPVFHISVRLSASAPSAFAPFRELLLSSPFFRHVPHWPHLHWRCASKHRWPGITGATGSDEQHPPSDRQLSVLWIWCALI